MHQGRKGRKKVIYGEWWWTSGLHLKKVFFNSSYEREKAKKIKFLPVAAVLLVKKRKRWTAAAQIANQLAVVHRRWRPSGREIDSDLISLFLPSFLLLISLCWNLLFDTQFSFADFFFGVLAPWLLLLRWLLFGCFCFLALSAVFLDAAVCVLWIDEYELCSWSVPCYCISSCVAGVLEALFIGLRCGLTGHERSDDGGAVMKRPVVAWETEASEEGGCRRGVVVKVQKRDGAAETCPVLFIIFLSFVLSIFFYVT